MRKIGLLDKNFAHAINTSDLVTLYQPEIQPFQWERNIEKCAFDSDIDTIVFTDECLHEVFRFANINKRKIAWILEPIEVSKFPYAFSAQYCHAFDAVVSSDLDFTKSIARGVYAPYGSTWIDKQDWGTYDKTNLVSMIASKKMLTSGHTLRFEAAKLLQKENVYGSINENMINKKVDGLKDYKFSIVVENCKRNGYFTEKIVDCFLTSTIPIYWGCPNIGDFFDVSGIIQFHTIEELSGILCNNHLNEFYNSNRDIVEKNLQLAKKFVSIEENFAKYAL